MDYKLLISKIFEKTKKDSTGVQAYEDIFDLCREYEKEDFTFAHKTNAELRRSIQSAIKQRVNVTEFFELYKKTLLFDAPYDFDSFCLYIEIKRRPQDRFYQNRRKSLKRIVDKLQMLADNELDELFISQPPRTGKTTLLIFFVCWIMGRNSEYPNLYSSYSDTITSAFYNGVLEIMQDKDTYLYSDVFPETKIVKTNSADEVLDIDRKKHYPSLTCRSLYGTLNGACDAERGVIIADDLIGSIEEALNPDRLKSAWDKVDNNLIPRGKETTKYLWCGTRWSIADPPGKRLELLQNDEHFKNYRFAVLNLPALDENDESNFEYDNQVGFNTQYYKQRRASFERNNDLASWLAQYQGCPIEREGALFTPADLRFYNGELPSETPDRIFMAVDPAFGGGDFVASPICFQYGDEIYVHDVVYDNNDKKITQSLLVNAVIRYKVNAMRVEANKATEAYKEGIEALLREKGYRLNITSKAAPNDKSKNQRIFDKAPDIRDKMIFREAGKRSKEYELFMQNVFSFKMFGKNKHDDAPDSLSMAIDMAFFSYRKAEIFTRPF